MIYYPHISYFYSHYPITYFVFPSPYLIQVISKLKCIIIIVCDVCMGVCTLGTCVEVRWLPSGVVLSVHRSQFLRITRRSSGLWTGCPLTSTCHNIHTGPQAWRKDHGDRGSSGYHSVCFYQNVKPGITVLEGLLKRSPGLWGHQRCVPVPPYSCFGRA